MNCWLATGAPGGDYDKARILDGQSHHACHPERSEGPHNDVGTAQPNNLELTREILRRLRDSG